MRKLSDFDYMLNAYNSQDQILEDLRKDFVRSYPVNYIRNQMKIEDYIEGKGNSDSFCNRLERQLVGLGSIKGANASKFGIYFSHKQQKYIINKFWQTPKNHPDLNLSFDKLRHSLADLIEYGKENREKDIEDHPLAPMIKMKILSVYYPYKYLNIFSARMLNYFLFQFYGNDFPIKASVFKKQRLLLQLKNTTKSTKNWNNIKFGNYLYFLFPKAADLGKENQFSNGQKNHYKIPYKQITPTLPTSNKESKHYLPIAYDKIATQFKQRTSNKNQSLTKINHIQKEKQNIDIGYKGEKIVMNFEAERLKERPNLVRQITWQAQKSDAIGYDILSFEEDGTPRQIEVKSTTAKPSNRFSFVLTENERQHALSLPNYWIYRVFNIDSDQPIIYRIKNPFKEGLVHLQPIRYQASIKVKDYQ